ncbi:aminotransferase class I/II-fold pyridoxal phosphate-dependent enzyme [Streptomyces sp. NPDC059590]|uniref:aminotransferase class I/II-fold pyridoxal phosphate-dependent enzyme n=1 Tax=Streptomyces sp. NPDC059590 TaxID=3346877 RepID=UPI00368C0954
MLGGIDGFDDSCHSAVRECHPVCFFLVHEDRYQVDSPENLTQHEQIAIDSRINLSDGHPRHDLTSSQSVVIDRLPELFRTASTEPFEKLERQALRAFMSALGQHSAPVETGRIFSLYSSSVATMALANALAELNHRVALLHPTFDNIHDILSRSVKITPIEEAVCAQARLEEIISWGATCLFITTPNNPTGWVLQQEEFERVVRVCAERNILLCLDTSFRGFDKRAQFDGYEVLHRYGAQYVVIEDTGKLWPMSELKLGILAVSEGMWPVMRKAVSDVLLTVSPLVLKLVESLSRDAAAGGLDRLHDLIAANRRRVARTVGALPGVTLPDPSSRISAARLAFPSAEAAARVSSDLLEHGIHVLPCRQFHWARPEEGGHLFRVALARNPDVIEAAMSRLSAAVKSSVGLD